jgi:hypothetical protein
MLCSGNPLEYCGAGNQLSVYINNNTVTTPSSTVSTSSATTMSTSTVSSPVSTALSAYTYIGCQTDNVNARTINAKSQAPNYGLTVEICATFCAGYTYFGVEYAQECMLNSLPKLYDHSFANTFIYRLLWQLTASWFNSSNRRTM